MCYNNFKENIWPLTCGVLERRYKIRSMSKWTKFRLKIQNPKEEKKILLIKLCSAVHVTPSLLVHTVYMLIYSVLEFFSNRVVVKESTVRESVQKSCYLFGWKKKNEINAQLCTNLRSKMSAYYFPSCINIIYNLMMWIVFVSPPGSLPLVTMCCWLSHAVAIATSS